MSGRRSAFGICKTDVLRTRSVDIGIANLAAHIAESDNVVRYRASEEDLKLLEEAVADALPGFVDWVDRQPVWVQLFAMFLIIYVPVFFEAVLDRWRKEKRNPNFIENEKQNTNDEQKEV